MTHSKCFYKSEGKCCNSRARDKGETCQDCNEKKTIEEKTVLVKVTKKGVIVAK